ncbi:MAG: L,D-transpeptidase [Pikeienuella sp.]
MRPGPDDLVVTRWGARFRGRIFPCSIGRAGLTAAKREGDMATPFGVYRITGGMYRADRIAPPPGAPLAPAGPRDIWSDDPRDPGYNRLSRNGAGRFGHERMRRADPLYDIVLFTDQNQPPVPGMGSAIFVHLWRGPRKPTAGCVAFRKRDLLWIWARWTARSRVIIHGAARSPKIAEPTRR